MYSQIKFYEQPKPTPPTPKPTPPAPAPKHVPLGPGREERNIPRVPPAPKK